VSSEEWPRDGNWTHDDVLRLATRQAEKISELRDQLRDAQSALYRTEEMKGHFTRAIANGVTKEELQGVITHLAFYSGWPNAVNAARVFGEVFES